MKLLIHLIEFHIQAEMHQNSEAFSIVWMYCRYLQIREHARFKCCLGNERERGSCSVVSSYMTCFRHIPCLRLSVVESHRWLGDTEVSLEQIASSSASDIQNFKYIQSKLVMIFLAIEIHRDEDLSILVHQRNFYLK